jgi:site-specific DNA-cytosine methylase
LYPQPGDIDVIVGGPPCQGFSGLNSARQGSAATEKVKVLTKIIIYLCCF